MSIREFYACADIGGNGYCQWTAASIFDKYPEYLITLNDNFGWDDSSMPSIDASVKQVCNFHYFYYR